MDYEWVWKPKKRTDFQQFFNNYGMNSIPFEDLEYFLKLGVGEIDTETFEKDNEELVQSHIQLKDKNKGKFLGYEDGKKRTVLS